MYTETLDEVIDHLSKLREKLGGKCRVAIKVYGRELLTPSVYVASAGKATPDRLVSRGGTPIVIVGE